MDNQPPAPNNNNTPQPPMSPPPTPPVQPSPAPDTPVVPSATPSQPVTPVPTNSVPQSINTKKKSHKGLIISIICALLVIIGGGIATAVVIIKTQPINMVTSAFNNLLNSEYVAINGQVDVSSIPALGDNYANITFDTIHSGADYSTTVTIRTSLPVLGITVPLTLEVDDVIIRDGTVYFKIKGLKETLTVEYISSVTSAMGADGFIDVDTMNLIQDIGAMLEDQWIKVAYPEILSSMMSDATQQIAQIDCTRDIFNNISQYSGELSNTYLNSPFLVMTQQDNSFYDISLSTAYLADFINSLPRTNLANDLAACYGANINNTPRVSVEDLKYLNDSLPNISAKFDGFMDYHLSELKISTKQDDDSYISAAADLKFSYTGNTTVATPSDSMSILEVIQKITMAIYSNNDSDDYIYDNCSPDTNCTTEIREYESDYYVSEN